MTTIHLKTNRHGKVPFSRDDYHHWKKPHSFVGLPKRDITIDNFIERVQIHGLIDWYRAKSCSAQSFWALMIVLLIATLILGVVLSVKEFYTNPVNTSICIVNSETVDFPDVYVCPMNVIDHLSEPRRIGHMKRFLRQQRYDVFGDTKSLWSELLPATEMLRPAAGEPSPTHRLLPLPPPTIGNCRQLMTSITLKPELVFEKCEFEGKPINCSEIVTPRIDKDHDLCYDVSVKRPQRAAGVGVRLLLNLHTERDDPRSPSPFDGVYFSVSKRTDPFSEVMDVSSPGKYVKVNLASEYAELINVPHSRTPQRCAEDGYGVPLAVLTGNYSDGLCRGDCIQATVWEKCACVLPVDPDYVQEQYRDAEFCYQSLIEKCASKILESHEESIRTCASKCLKPCKSWSVHPRVSAMDLSSRRSRQFGDRLRPDMSQSMNPTYWQDNYVVLDISFSKLQYAAVVQSEAKTIAELLSDIGGQAGLWLGTSMFSFVQLFVLVAGYFYTKGETRREPDIDGNSNVTVGVVPK